MGVIRTDKWLLEFYKDPIELCKNLTKYFYGVNEEDIYIHLVAHGMYRYPKKSGTELVQSFKKNNVWEIIEREKNILQKKWQGPNVPIFIFPVDTNNRKIDKVTGGKSGLAFKDKLFIFISSKHTNNEIKALFTHEYNHICRLENFSKKESDYVLLDTIILEGLAENAVHNRIGKDFVAPWTKYYSTTELKKIWTKIIYPNRKISNLHPKHQKILYGLRLYPEMAGYAVGYFLVKEYMTKKKLTDQELLSIPSEKIAQIEPEK